ncbi:hypothetical protein [Streptomyces sp. NPDC054834]
MLDYLERLLPLLSAGLATTVGLRSIYTVTKQKRAREVPEHARGGGIIANGDTVTGVIDIVNHQDDSIHVEDGSTVSDATTATVDMDRWITSPMYRFLHEDELQQAAEEAARQAEDVVRRAADEDADLLPDETGHLSTDDERLVADNTADVINLTLARLFVRLGPPPLETNGGDFAPVSSGDGGSAR